MREKELEGKVTPPWVRKKWENLKQKYKVMSCIQLFYKSRVRTNHYKCSSKARYDSFLSSVEHIRCLIGFVFI